MTQQIQSNPAHEAIQVLLDSGFGGVGDWRCAGRSSQRVGRELFKSLVMRGMQG